MRRDKPAHRTDQDVVPTPGIRLGLGVGSDALVRVFVGPMRLFSSHTLDALWLFLVEFKE